MPDEPGLIEAANVVAAVAAGHGRHVRQVRRITHGRHGRLDVARVELGVGMGVERGAKTFGVASARVGGHHALLLAFWALTFFSITSQIMAAMSGPPKAAICLMPVGEVTLISVR